MSKKKISIIGMVAILVIVVGLGFNSIFSKAKEDTATKNKTNVSSETLSSDSEDSKDDLDRAKDKTNDTEEKSKEEKKNELDKKEDEESDSKKDEESSGKDKNDSSDKNDSNKNENSSNSNSSNSNNGTTQNKPQSNPTTPAPAKKTVTVSISCRTAINGNLNKEPGFTHLPSSGAILSSATVEIEDGETVFDVLVKVSRKYGIHMEYTGSGSSIYVEGIKNLYEFDGGPGSGWMYSVNGVYPNYGAGSYKVKNNDVIRWNYTMNLGADLGASRN